MLSNNMLRDNKYDRIWRCAYPEDVLHGNSLEEQAAALGRWVIDSFATLYRLAADPV